MHSDDCAISPPGGAGSVSAGRIFSQEKSSGGCECHPVIGTGRGDETIGFEVHHRGGRQHQRGATPSSHPETHHVRLSLLYFCLGQPLDVSKDEGWSVQLAPLATLRCKCFDGMKLLLLVKFSRVSKMGGWQGWGGMAVAKNHPADRHRDSQSCECGRLREDALSHISLITPNRKCKPSHPRAGQCFVFDALYSSKSGPIHKHVVKHSITSRPTTVFTFSSTDP